MRATIRMSKIASQRLLASIRMVPNFLALKSFQWRLNVWKLGNGQLPMRLQVLFAFVMDLLQVWPPILHLQRDVIRLPSQNHHF